MTTKRRDGTRTADPGIHALDRIERVYSARNKRELIDRYDRWASDYERDLTDSLGYVGAKRGAELLARHVSKDGRVLDAGAGTGLAGQALKQIGFSNLVALDASRGMLREARTKGVYQALYCRDLDKPLGFLRAFDAVISIGVFTYGHVGAGAFEALLEVTKPGGHIVFSLRPDFFEAGGFKGLLASLESEERVSLVEGGEAFRCFSTSASGTRMQLWAYRIN